MHKIMKVFCLYTSNSIAIPHIASSKNVQYPFSGIQEMLLGNQLLLDIMKGIIIPILGYSIKHHILIHFGICYEKGITHDQKDGVKLQHPSYNIPKSLSGFNHVSFDN